MAVSRRLRLRGEMERFFSRSLRNAATNGASISSKVSREGGLCRCFSINRNRRRKASRYEAMVCVLACFCCSKRWVKKPSNKPGKLDVLFISESSNASLTAQRPVPSVLDKRSDTSRYRLDGRVRDKWKEPEGAARHRRRSDTNVKVFEWRIDGANADIGISDSMPSPGLCRVWWSSSSTIPIWRFFPHFSNKVNSA